MLQRCKKKLILIRLAVISFFLWSDARGHINRSNVIEMSEVGDAAAAARFGLMNLMKASFYQSNVRLGFRSSQSPISTALNSCARPQWAYASDVQEVLIRPS